MNKILLLMSLSLVSVAQASEGPIKLTKDQKAVLMGYYRSNPLKNTSATAASVDEILEAQERAKLAAVKKLTQQQKQAPLPFKIIPSEFETTQEGFILLN